MSEDWTEAEIIRLYDAGKLSMKAVAAKTGAPYSKVRTVIGRAGVQRPGGGPVKAVTSPAQAAPIIAACTEGGLTMVQAGAAFGISRYIVSRVLREYGGLLPPAAASALAGITPEELRLLAGAGEVRSAACAGAGRLMYYRDDMLRLAQSRQALAALRWAWDGVYRIIEGPDGTLEALRADCLESVRAATPEELRDRIREDYARMPVLAT